MPHDESTSPSPPIRWLHLSDLHVGSPGRASWWRVREDFWRSLESVAVKVGGPPDLLLFTGDLVWKGSRKQYDDLDRFLDALREHLGRVFGHADPLLLPVPGNHDIARPEGGSLRRELALLKRYDEMSDDDVRDLREQIWTRRDPSPVAKVFAEYTKWFRRRVLKDWKRRGVPHHVSFFPGDWSVRFERDDGFCLGVVGLNSAWVQYTGGDFLRKIQLPAEQFEAAFPNGGDGPLTFLERCDRKLLLLHHPPEWLSPAALRVFKRDVYPTRRFDLCLHGHMHEGRSSYEGLAEGNARAWFQGYSLFGMEHWGDPEKEQRAFGYAFGAIEPNGRIRLWPQTVGLRRDGTEAFDVDTSMGERDRDDAVVLRQPDPASGARPDGVLVAPLVASRVRKAEEDEYREWALSRFQRLSMVGLGSGDLALEFDDVYVPLRVHANVARAAVDGLDVLACRTAGVSGDVELHQIFELAGAQRDLVVFGEPGAGKTTVQKKLLHEALSKGAASLGLSAATLPVFLSLRRLTRERLRQPFHRYLQAELEWHADWAGSRVRFAPDLCERLWERGHLLLLLDGLDEIADPSLRADVADHLCAILPDARKRGVRTVLSTRFAGYGGAVVLDEGFVALEVRALDRNQVRQLVRTWFPLARRAQATSAERGAAAEAQGREEAEQLLERLESEEYASQKLKVLEGTPLLLTLLCAVVLRGGRIPEDRAQFYDECLRVLLGRWTEAKRIAPPLPVDDTLAVLRPLAWQMHDENRKDDLTKHEFALWTSVPLDRANRRRGSAVEPDALREWLHHTAGVLERYGPGRYGFAHSSFQEYLAAMHAAREGGTLLDELAANFGVDHWKEVTLLLVGQSLHKTFVPLMEKVARSPALEQRIDLVRQCLREAAEPSPAPFLPILVADGAPSSRTAAVLRLFAERDEPEIIAAAEALRAHEDPDVADLARRVCERAARPGGALGGSVAFRGAARAARPRPGEAFEETSTGIRFLWVPGGRFVSGSSDRPAEPTTRPSEVDVAPFWLAETPITNAQYALFLAEGDAREPEYWRDRRFSAPDQPVVGVDWFGAVAFGEWLAARAGVAVRLPSEDEWEFAARGADGRPYPWGGDELTARHANFGQDWRKGQPDPVGAHPAGKGPFGHLDLAGGVWEWCVDDVTAAFGDTWMQVFRRGDEECAPALRALRGGAWLNAAEHLRCAIREWVPATDRNWDVGFRVAASHLEAAAL